MIGRKEEGKVQEGNRTCMGAKRRDEGKITERERREG